MHWRWVQMPTPSSPQEGSAGSAWASPQGCVLQTQGCNWAPRGHLVFLLTQGLTMLGARFQCSEACRFTGRVWSVLPFPEEGTLGAPDPLCQKGSDRSVTAPGSPAPWDPSSPAQLPRWDPALHGCGGLLASQVSERVSLGGAGTEGRSRASRASSHLLCVSVRESQTTVSSQGTRSAHLTSPKAERLCLHTLGS